MTDQADDIQKLKDKISQLIEEKRKVQAERDSLRVQLEEITSENETNKHELHRILVEQPRFELLEEIAMPNMADVLQRELLYHFQIVRDDEGKDWIHQEGQPVLLNEQPVPYSKEGIHKLQEAGRLKVGTLLKGSGTTGGGALGGDHARGITTTTRSTVRNPASSFGFR